jgi:hypothetical protein
LPGGPPVVTARALEVLTPVLGTSVEALPLLYEGTPAFALNVLDVVDCLDRDASDLLMAEDDISKILNVHHYVFKPGSIGERYMFRIEGLTKFVFVTKRFRDVVEKSRLRGLRFTPLR